KLTPGTRLLIHGKLDRSGFRVDAHELAGDAGEGAGGLHTTGIVPVHPATDGIKPQKLREWAHEACGGAADAIEPLPAHLCAARGMPGGADALVAAHFPVAAEEVEAARERLAFEELLLHQAALATRREGRDSRRTGVAIRSGDELASEWLASLPFELTGDQRNACDAIDADLGSGRPMQRLLMGEVGSGKTVCAVYAMLRAVGAGFQAALMAPTETLAEQHFHTLDR